VNRELSFYICNIVRAVTPENWEFFSRRKWYIMSEGVKSWILKCQKNGVKIGFYIT